MTQSSGAMPTYFQNGREEETDNSSKIQRTSWFALQTRPRYEKQINSELQAKGIDAFLPLYSTTRQWSDRRHVVQSPLFASYVFVRIANTLEARIPVLRTNAVVRFVGTRGIGDPIPDEQVQALQAIMMRTVPFRPCSYHQIGRRVRLRGGSLDGIEGILTAVNGHDSVVISVDIIQRSVAMRVTGYRIEPA